MKAMNDAEEGSLVRYDGSNNLTILCENDEASFTPLNNNKSKSLCKLFEKKI